MHRLLFATNHHRLANTVLDSLGATLTDTLDDLITDHRIDPQLAMKILANFDRAIADVLQDKVKARLTFKVRRAQPAPAQTRPFAPGGGKERCGPCPRSQGKDSLAWPRNLADMACLRAIYTGLAGYLPLLRRGVDFPDQERILQDGERRPARHGRQGQDCQLQCEASGRPVDGTLSGKRYSDFGVGSDLGLWIGVTAGHLSMHHGMGFVIVHIEGTFFAHPQLTASTTNQERNRSHSRYP